MDLARPLRVVTPTLDGDVLMVLAGADMPFTGRQAAKLVGEASVSGVRRVLERLVGEGVVLREAAGSAYLYRLNREHLGAPHIIALARLRDELVARVRALVAAWSAAPDVVVLFGSGARGDMHPASDIDLFVVRPPDVDDGRWDEQIGHLQAQVTAWTGNDTRVLQMHREDVPEAVLAEPVLVDIRDHGWVLYGPTSYFAKLAAASVTA